MARGAAWSVAGTALLVFAWSAATADEKKIDPPAMLLARAARAVADGRPADALRELEPLAADYPRSAGLQLRLGLAYEKQERYRVAAERLRRALELDPRLHEARAPLGWCLYYLGRLEEAREEFERYLAAAPTDTRALLALGLIEFDADRLDGARTRWLRAIELARAGDDAGTEALLRARLADVELRAGQLETARRLLVVAIKLDPRNESYYYKLARVLQRIGDADGARRVLARREAIRAADPVSEPGR